MPVYENPTRNVLSFGANPPYRRASVSLYPNTCIPKTLPKDAVLSVELSEKEARPFVDKGLIKLLTGAAVVVPPAFTAAGRPTPDMSDVKTTLTTLLPVDEDERPRTVPKPAPLPAPARDGAPAVQYPSPTGDRVDPAMFVGGPLAGPQDLLSETHPSRLVEKAQDIAAEHGVAAVAPAIATIAAAIATESPPVATVVVPPATLDTPPATTDTAPTPKSPKRPRFKSE